MDKLKPCKFCGKEVAEIANCIENEECANFEECPAQKPYVCVVCGMNKGGCGVSSGYYDADEKAAAAWNRRPPNKPLTLEQLREMDGEPVYLVKESDGYKFGYAIIDANDKRLRLGSGGSLPFQVIEDGAVIAYRQRPEGSDHDKL